MKFSEQWLKEWVDPGLSTKELAQQLTMVGLEVDEICPVVHPIAHVIIGQIDAVEQHPNADQLVVCRVQVGKPDRLTIVCGAKNVAVGQKVPVAMLGGQVGDLRIKQAKLRGILSEGMLCSAQELGLAERSEGIFLLPDDAPIGQSIIDYLELADQQIALSITPNRGDCLSIVGIAREVAAVNRLPINQPIISSIPAQIEDMLPVVIQAPQACLYYTGRIIQSINPHATTPLWMVEKLRRSGIRSLSPVVDVLNYVMLEWGQPLHAFDLAKLEGAIHVRFAKPKENLTLLDNQSIELTDESLIIADEMKPLALAGVMGGLDSSVTTETVDIFLEAAHFAPRFMAGAGRRYGLQTESSYRFERGVDPTLPRKAIERATQLLLAIVGGKPGPITTVTQKDYFEPVTLVLQEPSIERLLGIQLAKENVTELLRALHFEVTELASGWQVTVPSYRFDLNQESDLIEEIARLHGYANIKPAILKGQLNLIKREPAQVDTALWMNQLVGRGYQEVITYSFTDAHIQRTLTPHREPISLLNPLSPELGVMRTSLWPGLIKVMQYNEHRQQHRLRLFEIGRCFWGCAPEQQPTMLAGLITGTVYPPQWDGRDMMADFYSVKADLVALLATAFAEEQVRFIAKEHPALHPGQTAQIIVAGNACGWLGQLHPRLYKHFKLKQPVILFELSLSDLPETCLPQFQPLSKFPSVRRDLALVMDEGMPIDQIIQAIREAIGSILQHIEIFDVYRGPGIPAGKKSVAISLTLQHAEQTLHDEEVEQLVAKVLNHLNQVYQTTLRD